MHNITAYVILCLIALKQYNFRAGIFLLEMFNF